MKRQIKWIGLAACCVCLSLTATGAEVIYDPSSPQLSFAAQKVSAALGQAEATVIFEIKPNAKKPESFVIEVPEPGTIQITGSDAAGAMYGGLEVAELIRIGGLNQVKADDQSPYMEMRGVKFNIPLDVRTPSYSDLGDAGQNSMEDVWDLKFWKEFIDEVAGHRYNYISLWSLHPFPSLIRVPDYPDVALADVKRATKVRGKQYSTNATGYDVPEILDHTETILKMTMDEKIDFWRKVMAYGKSRNVDFYFVTWNIYAYGTDGKYGIDNHADNPVTIDYYRKSVKQLFLTYPDLKGIGLATGEDMHGLSQSQKEEWAYQTYGLGVLDVVKEQPGRKITFLHRQHQSGALEIAETFKPLIDHKDIDFIFSFKYAKAHVYSATAQPYHPGFVNDIKGRGDLKTIWTMRNDSAYLYRWAAPDFVREFVQNIPYDVSRGYYFGSDGWVWGRDFLDKNPEEPNRIELKKHWFEWLLWGRLAYDPTLSNERFVGILQSRFPGVDAAKLMDAWEAASMIYPITTGFHWGSLDFQWYIEGCKSLPGRFGTENGFHNVDHFINLGTHDCSGYTSIKQYVETVVKGESFTGTGPNEVAQQLHDQADKALRLLKELKAGDDWELTQTLADIETLAYLGHYYGHKIKGATELHLYRKTGEKQHQKTAIAELEEAAVSWRQYTANSNERYTNPVWYNRVGMVDWDEITEWVDGDIEIAKNAQEKK